MGRPPLAPEDRKLPAMGVRPTPELRQKLEEAAARSGRSMSQEVQSRLERTFPLDRFASEVGDDECVLWMQILADWAIKVVGPNWYEDPRSILMATGVWQTFAKSQARMNAELINMQPLVKAKLSKDEYDFRDFSDDAAEALIKYGETLAADRLPPDEKPPAPEADTALQPKEPQEPKEPKD